MEGFLYEFALWISENTLIFTFSLAGWIASASIATTIAGNKGANPLLWVFYGLLLGPVALVHAIIRRRTPNRFVSGFVAGMGLSPCPMCDEFIDPGATVCPRCRRDIEPSSLSRDEVRQRLEERMSDGGTVSCPKCIQLVSRRATVCPNCQRDIEPPPVERQSGPYRVNR